MKIVNCYLITLDKFPRPEYPIDPNLHAAICLVQASHLFCKSLLHHFVHLTKGIAILDDDKELFVIEELDRYIRALTEAELLGVFFRKDRQLGRHSLGYALAVLEWNPWFKHLANSQRG